MNSITLPPPGAKRDIAYQVPVEMRIREILALLWNGLMEPKEWGVKDAKKDFVIVTPGFERRLVEVKCDWKSEETGNLMFETYDPLHDKPKAMGATKADWWVQFLPHISAFYLFETRFMLDLLDLESSQQYWVPKIGDGNAAGYAVPRSVIDKLTFVKLHPIPLL